VGGCVYFLRKARLSTAIYNIERETFEDALAHTFRALGLNPERQGSRFYFDVKCPDARKHEAEISARDGDQAQVSTALQGTGRVARPSTDFNDSTAILDVDPFGPLHHVTLHWQAKSAVLRYEIERELTRYFRRAGGKENPVGDWLLLLALALIGFNLLVTFGLTVLSFLRR
jgi:hypothetical protein